MTCGIEEISVNNYYILRTSFLQVKLHVENIPNSCTFGESQCVICCISQFTYLLYTVFTIRENRFCYCTQCHQRHDTLYRVHVHTVHSLTVWGITTQQVRSEFLVSDVWMHFIWIWVCIILICVYYQHHTYWNDIFTMYFTIYCWRNKIFTPYISAVYQCSLKLTAHWRWL